MEFNHGGVASNIYGSLNNQESDRQSIPASFHDDSDDLENESGLESFT